MDEVNDAESNSDGNNALVAAFSLYACKCGGLAIRSSDNFK